MEQRTSMMENTISFWEDLGPPIQGSPDGSRCKFLILLIPMCLEEADICYSVNWYQRNYLYAWAGARVVKDA